MNETVAGEQTRESAGATAGARVVAAERSSPRPVAPFRKPCPGTQPEYLHPTYVSSLSRAPKLPLIALPPTLSETTGPDLSSAFSDPKAPILPNNTPANRSASGLS